MSRLAERIAESSVFKRFFGSDMEESRRIVSFVLVAFTVFILSGGIYLIVTQPTSGYAFYPGLSDQSVTEGMVFMFLLISASAGSYLILRSTSLIYRPRDASIMLFGGISLLVMAFLSCEYILYLKYLI